MGTNETVLEAAAQSLHASPLLRGAEIRKSDHGLEMTRGSARVLILPCVSLSDSGSILDVIGSGDTGLLLLGDVPSWLPLLPLDKASIALLPDNVVPEVLCLTAHGLLERVELRRHALQRISELSRFQYERGELMEIARAITRERDITRLLGLILEKSRYITGADAGSIYVLEGEASDPDGQRLHFKLSQNDSMSYESSEFAMPVSTRSIAGAAVVTREAINIKDVYELDATVPYSFDRSFDKRMGYRTGSMIAVPMISAKDEVIGVIQLINKKKNPRIKLRRPEDFEQEITAFDARSEELLSALSAQAGIALENALLYDEIRRLFEGFVGASVQAIEQRDPTTSGHSLRVSVLSCRLAEIVDQTPTGPYRDEHFARRDLRELKYAALLHDFGKIGVREQVLVKAKKLYGHEREAVRLRIDFALKAAEAELLRAKLQRLERGADGQDPAAGGQDIAALELAYEQRRQHLLAAWGVIERADEPSVLSEGDFSAIAEIGAITFANLNGDPCRLLSDSEMIALQITRGSLSPKEIQEIRSHVVHTFNFLSKIPWGKTMERIPEIARGHHEKLNGGGYPLGIGAGEILVQSKIMAVADIFDALTAADRPYKKALPLDRALQILDFEVKDGNLDAELVRIFREAEVHKTTVRDIAY